MVNPKGGAGKTVAMLLLAMTFGQKRGGYVLAWDNNETQGTLGMRAQQDFHARTVRDLLRDLRPVPGRARPGRRPVAVRARPGRGHVRRARLGRVGHRRRDAHRRRVRRDPRGGQPVLQADHGGHRQQRPGRRTGRPRSTPPTSSWSPCRPATTRPRPPPGCSTTWSRPAGSGWSGRRSPWCRCRRTARRSTCRRSSGTSPPGPGRCCWRRTSGSSTPASRCGTARLSPDTRDAWLKIAAAVAEGL